MNRILLYISAISLCSILSIDTKAQSNDNFNLLQEISVDNITINKEKKKKNGQQQLELNDSLFKMYDVDIDLSLGSISFDVTWGDPINNPEIRRNRASNLFGPVRHNADGSIRWHQGFDYYAPKGTPVMAVGDGVVSLVQKDHPGYGMCVLITHKRAGKTYYSFYAHLSSITVEYGQTIQKGTVIGKSGTSGNSNNLTGEDEHLHFEYRTSPKHSDRKQSNPNAILKTKFYSADPKNEWQSNVDVIKKDSFSL